MEQELDMVKNNEGKREKFKKKEGGDEETL